MNQHIKNSTTKSMTNLIVEYLKAYTKKRKEILNRWSCDICGGDDETGCQYFDPSECPR